VAGIAAASAAVSFMGTLVPETGYDSLIQHLADPREYLRARRITFNDLSFLAQHPGGIEMLYAWLIPWGGDEAAKMLHAAFAIMTCWAFRHFMRRYACARDATVLSLVLYLTPFNGILSTRAYVDHGLVFYGAAALLAPWGSCMQGAFIGFAIGAKYLGGFILIGWAAAFLASGAPAGAVRIATAAAMGAVWWGARNWLNTGNPVYPFGFSVLGGLGWDAHSAREYSAELGSYGSVEGVAGWLSIPWLAFVHDRGALDDGSLGPLYLVFAPLLLLRGVAGRAIGNLRILVAALWVLWLVSPRQVRYALLLMPPTLALLATGMRRARDAWPVAWRAGAMLLPAVLFVQFLISFAAIYVWVNPLYVASGAMGGMEYLEHIIEPRDRRTGRSMYMDLIPRLSAALPASARTYMLGDAKVYYLPGRWSVNALFNPPLLARIVRQSFTGGDVARRLRQRGLTHVLYNVGGSIHIEHTHHLFHFDDREFGLVESFARGWLGPRARYDNSDGDSMYMLFEIRAGKYPDLPYLPGLDTRLAKVESLVIDGKGPQAREEIAGLLKEYPSSRWLRGRLKAALKLKKGT
jgi:hypothetical protein